MFARALAGLEQKASADAGCRRGAGGVRAAGACACCAGPATCAESSWLRVARTGITPGGESLPQASFGHALALTLAGGKSPAVAASSARHRWWSRSCAHVRRALFGRSARAARHATGSRFDLEVGACPRSATCARALRSAGPCLRDKPEFALRIDYDELADASEQQIPLGALFMAGKVRIDGDVAKAMLLGMTLAQLP